MGWRVGGWQANTTAPLPNSLFSTMLAQTSPNGKEIGEVEEDKEKRKHHGAPTLQTTFPDKTSTPKNVYTVICDERGGWTMTLWFPPA